MLELRIVYLFANQLVKLRSILFLQFPDEFFLFFPQVRKREAMFQAKLNILLEIWAFNSQWIILSILNHHKIVPVILAPKEVLDYLPLLFELPPVVFIEFLRWGHRICVLNFEFPQLLREVELGLMLIFLGRLSRLFLETLHLIEQVAEVFRL